MLIDLLRENVTWIDALDIFFVAMSVYFFLKLIQGTKASQILIGILPFVGLWILANLLHMKALNAMLAFILPVVGIGFIVVFQPELRKLFSEMGQWKALKPKSDPLPAKRIDQIALALDALSENRIGAIIVIMRIADIDSFLSVKGIKLDCDITKEVLVAIFQHTSPLHDGAVIIKEDKITYAAAILPLSDELRLSKKYGTRHRAALGLSEETDALVIVVSEETGGISLVHDGTLEGPYDAKSIAKRIQEITHPIAITQNARKKVHTVEDYS